MHKNILFLVAVCFILGQILMFPLDTNAKTSQGWDQVPKILDRINPPTFPDQDFNIADYGAVGDGVTKSTEAFKKAIEAAHREGGGKVVVPEGIYLSGAIHLKSNVNLHVTKDAEIKFSQDPKDYLPVVHTRYEGQELYNYSPFIYANNQENIAITGKGIIDGQADNDHWWPWSDGSDKEWADKDLLSKMVKDEVPVNQRKFGEGHYLRPNMIQFYNSKNIMLEDVTIENSPMWHIHPILSENVTIQNVNIKGHGPNNDGINPESSKDVLIKNNDLDTGDDSIAIKSGKDEDGRRINVPSENIIILENHMEMSNGGVTIGSEMTGGVKNVFAKDNVMDSPNLKRALRLKTNPKRGGYIKNIYFKDNLIENLSKQVIEIHTDYANVHSGDYIPVIRNIEINNLKSNGGQYAISIKGLDQSPVQDVRIIDSKFNNVQESARIENVEGLELNNVSINGEQIYSLMPSNDTQDMKTLVERLENGGEFSSSDAAHALKMHLTAVNHFEEKGASKKVITHLKGFKSLLEHQKENELITEKAYKILKDDAVHLINEWH